LSLRENLVQAFHAKQVSYRKGREDLHDLEALVFLLSFLCAVLIVFARKLVAEISRKAGKHPQSSPSSIS
jgi:hypothetical protein